MHIIRLQNRNTESCANYRRTYRSDKQLNNYNVRGHTKLEKRSRCAYIDPYASHMDGTTNVVDPIEYQNNYLNVIKNVNVNNDELIDNYKHWTFF